MMPYDMPMTLDDVLADEERRRAAIAFTESVPVPPVGPGTGNRFPEPSGTAGTDFEALAHRYAQAQQQDAQQRREDAFSRGAAGAADVMLQGWGLRAPAFTAREPDAAGDVLRSARAQAEIAKMGRPATAAGGKAPPNNNPDSPEAKVLQDAVRARYPGTSEAEIRAITPATFDQWRISLDAKSGEGVRRDIAGATIEEQKARRRQDAYQFAKRYGLDLDKFDQAKQEFIEELAAKEKAAATKTAKDAEGQTVPAGEAASIGQSKAAIAALDVLEKQFRESGAAGVGGKVSALLPWDTDPVKYEDDVLAAAQAVGTILEGGKLAAGDEVKYRKLFPKAGDSLERGLNKLANVKRLVGDLTDAKVEALDAAGFNVKGFKPKQSKATPAAVPPPSEGKVRVRQKSTGKVKELDPEAAEKVLKKAELYERVP